MSDFYQHSEIDTYHLLKHNPGIKKELKNYEGKIHLVLPSLYDEIKTEALQGIRERLPEIDYIDTLVLVLNGPKTGPNGEKMETNKRDFDEFREFFSGLPYESRIVWDRSEGIINFYESLKGKELSFGEQGKGKAVHLGNGYALGTDASIIAHHDCDILTYDPKIVDRLVYPAAFLGKDFCKGFYGRYKERLFGRVERIFVTPFIHVLLEMVDVTSIPKAHAFLRFLGDIRYKLTGENAETASYSMKKNIPWDWALEIGELADAYKKCGPNNICQSEILKGPYEHKHQKLTPGDTTTGLGKMATDIGKRLIRDLVRKYRVVLTDAHFRTIREAYIEKAHGMVHSYEGDAKINGIPFNIHEEKSMVHTFVKSLEDAERVFQANLGKDTSISSWERIISADPDALNKLVDTVEKDNKAPRMI